MHERETRQRRPQARSNIDVTRRRRRSQHHAVAKTIREGVTDVMSSRSIMHYVYDSIGRKAAFVRADGHS